MTEGRHSRRAFLGASGAGLVSATLATDGEATHSTGRTARRERSSERYVVRVPADARTDGSSVTERLEAVRAAIEGGETITPIRTFERCAAALIELPNDPALLDAIRDHDAVSTLRPNDADWAPIPEPPETPRGPTPTQAGEVTPALDQLNVPAFWNSYNTRGDGIDVAVVDSGIQPDGHPGLAASLEAGGWIEFDDTGEPIESEPSDEVGHGTSVCGLIAGEQTDEGQAYGVAPEVALHVMRAGESAANFLASMEYVMANEIDVLSLSLGGLTYDRFQAEVYGEVVANGVTIVASVGNAGRYTAAMPGNMPTTIGVGATDGWWPAEWSGGETIRTERYWADPPADWPAEYTVPQVVAPGVDVITALADGTYGPRGGSSFSTPLVAGVVALVQAANGVTDPAEINDLIRETATHPAEGAAFEAVTADDDRAGAGIPDPVHATASAGDRVEISGTVVDPEGQPLPGAAVESSFGPRMLTGGDGTFSLQLPEREQTLHVDGVGLSEASTTIDPAQQEEPLSITVDRASDPALNLQEPNALHAAPGDEVGAGFLAGNIEAVRVEVTIAGLLSPDHLQLNANETPLTPGEWTSLENPIPRGPLSITAAVADDSPIGVAFLSLTVRNEAGEELQGSLNRLHIHDEPWRLPVTDPPVLQEAIEIAAPESTIEFTGERRQVGFGEERPAALVIDKPLTLTTAPDAEVTLAFEAPPAPQAPGIDVTANDVTLRGLTLEGTGGMVVRAGRGFQNRETVAPSALTIDGLEIAGGETGLVTDLAPAMRLANSTVTGGGVGIEVRNQAGTTIQQSRLVDNEVGVVVSGAIRAIANSQFQDGTVGILIDPGGQVFDPGDDARSAIDGNTFRSLGTGIRIASAAAIDILNNQFTEIDAAPIQLDADLHGNVLGNELADPTIGLLHGDGSVTGEVQEFAPTPTPGEPPGGTTPTPTPTPQPEPDPSPTPTPGSIPSSSLDLALYALATGSVGALFVPYLYRRFRR